MLNQSDIRKEIVNLLKKYYYNYNQKKWTQFENKRYNNLEQDFNNIWKNEHGGYISPQLLKKLSSNKSPLPEILPKLIKSENRLILPETPSNRKSFQKKYVLTANKLLCEINTKKPLFIDLRDNNGGKPEVMVAGLLPLLMLVPSKVLTYTKTRDGKFKKDLIREKNCITSIINDYSKICGSNKKLKQIPDKIIVLSNSNTISSAEQTVIVLKILSKITNIYFSGENTAGYTTTNKYFNLSNSGGIEIPCGIMSDYKKNIYPNGVNISYTI